MNLGDVIRTLPKPLAVRVVQSEFSGYEMTEIRPDQDVTANGRRQAAVNRADRRREHTRRVQAMRDAGVRVPYIAHALGLSDRYVRRLLRK